MVYTSFVHPLLPNLYAVPYKQSFGQLEDGPLCRRAAPGMNYILIPWCCAGQLYRPIAGYLGWPHVASNQEIRPSHVCSLWFSRSEGRVEMGASHSVPSQASRSRVVPLYRCKSTMLSQEFCFMKMFQSASSCMKAVVWVLL